MVKLKYCSVCVFAGWLSREERPGHEDSERAEELREHQADQQVGAERRVEALRRHPVEPHHPVDDDQHGQQQHQAAPDVACFPPRPCYSTSRRTPAATAVASTAGRWPAAVTPEVRSRALRSASRPTAATKATWTAPPSPAVRYRRERYAAIRVSSRMPVPARRAGLLAFVHASMKCTPATRTGPPEPGDAAVSPGGRPPVPPGAGPIASASARRAHDRPAPRGSLS